MSIKTDDITIAAAQSGQNITIPNASAFDGHRCPLIAIRAADVRPNYLNVKVGGIHAGLMAIQASDADVHVIDPGQHGAAGILSIAETSGVFVQHSYAALTVIAGHPDNYDGTYLANPDSGFYVGQNLILWRGDSFSKTEAPTLSRAVILSISPLNGTTFTAPYGGGTPNNASKDGYSLKLQGDFVLGDKCRIFDKDGNLIVNNGKRV